MSEIVEIEVAGRVRRLRSEPGGADLEAVAALVNERIAAVKAAGPDLSEEQLAVLALLNLGEELLLQQAAAEAEGEAVGSAVEAVRERLVALAGQLGPTGGRGRSPLGGGTQKAGAKRSGSKRASTKRAPSKQS